MTEREAVVAWLRAQSEECWARAAAARVAKQPNRSVVQTAMSDAFLEVFVREYVSRNRLKLVRA